MACCVLLMSLVGQFFAWRRKIWQALGLPVADWDGTEPDSTFRQTWAKRFSQWSQARATRFALGSLLAIELAILSASAWGGTNLYLKHKEHVHEFWSYVTGQRDPQLPICKGSPTAAAASTPL